MGRHKPGDAEGASGVRRVSDRLAALARAWFYLNQDEQKVLLLLLALFLLGLGVRAWWR